MALLLGALIPAALAACSLLVSWVFGVVLAFYVIVIVSSDTVRRVGRAGGVLPLSCGRRRVVLGGGWSWILRRRRLPPNCIVCKRGRSTTPGWWHAGTTIREVQSGLAMEGRTLAGHPSILSASLGGWIGSKSHGTGGSLWTPTMGQVLVELDDGRRRVLPAKEHVNIDEMIVREVEIHSVPNVVCERRVTYLTSEAVVAQTLFRTPTHLRAIFVDRYQSLCITWCPTNDQTSPVPSSCEFPPLWLMTMLPAARRNNLTVERWTRRMTLRDANALGPDPPFIFATAAMATHTNFEIFVSEHSTPNLIWRLCTEFGHMFSIHNGVGRLELRFGRNKQFLDFDVLRGMERIDLILSVLRSVYGADVTFALHPGKAQIRHGA